MSLKKLVLALFALACGGSPTSNNPDAGPDSQVNYTDGSNDGKLDSGSKDTNGNNPPNIQFDSEMTRNIRVGTPKNLVALVNDPDGDSVECKFNFGDGTPETNYGSCSTAHTFSNTGQYSVNVTARDSKGLENSVSDLFTAYTNIPPHVVLDCPEVDPADGLCVYRGKAWTEFCVDGSASFDEDGEIILYKTQSGQLSSTNENPIKCFAHSPNNTMGTIIYSVEDNENLWSSVNVKTITED